MSNDDAEIQAFIREMFEENYELLRLEGAGALSPDAKETALQQVLLYWRKMKKVAESITDTEVKLSLPGQATVEGRGFTIQGVVDIVRERGRTIMYDIKTHNAEYVRANKELYEQQLNVYAYIWQELRGQPLNETAIIATDFPKSIKAALSSHDDEQLDRELAKWNPLVPIPFNIESVQATIDEFAEVVDAIEATKFTPRPVQDLGERLYDSKELFVTRVCANCDGRFSCSSYRQYMLQGRGRVDGRFREYFGTDAEQESWRMANLDAARDTEELIRDYGR
jgi:hypothetical protein